MLKSCLQRASTRCELAAGQAESAPQVHKVDSCARKRLPRPEGLPGLPVTASETACI